MTKENVLYAEKKLYQLLRLMPAIPAITVMLSKRIHPKEKEENNEEERMQCKFFEEVEKLFPRLPNKLLFAVPNGGSRHIREAANLKRQGVTSGVSDVILLIPKKGYASLCIEFKTKKGIQSEEQKEFQRQAENCRNKYVIARSVKQGIDALKEYLL